MNAITTDEQRIDQDDLADEAPTTDEQAEELLDEAEPDEATSAETVAAVEDHHRPHHLGRGTHEAVHHAVGADMARQLGLAMPLSDAALFDGIIERERARAQEHAARTQAAHRAAEQLDAADKPLWDLYTRKRFGAPRPYDHREALNFSVARESLQAELDEAARAADEAREAEEQRQAEDEFTLAEWREEVEERQLRVVAAEHALAEAEAARSIARRELADARAGVAHAAGVVERMAKTDLAERARRQHVRTAAARASVAAHVAQKTGVLPRVADDVVAVLGTHDPTRAVRWTRHALARGLNPSNVDPAFDA